MAKKSFFERLVGATEKSGEKFFEELPSIPKSKPIKKSQKRDIEKTKIEQSIEEWSSDEEGQLMIDVYRTDSDMVIKSAIAGIKSEDIDISISNNTVTIKGRRRKNESIPPENYDLQEIYWGPFSRSVILPTDIDAEKIKASLKDGILTIRFPKLEKTKTKTIKVREVE